MTSTLQSIASSTSKLRALLQETRKDLERIQALQTALTEALEGLFGSESVGLIQEDVASAFELAGNEELWRETLSLVPSGRVLGVCAQAEDALAAASSNVRDRPWTADGKAYTRWIARGIVALSTSASTPDLSCPASSLLARAAGLGHADTLFGEVTRSLVFDSENQQTLYTLVGRLPAWDRRQYLASLLRFLDDTTRPWTKPGDESETAESRVVAGCAALLKDLCDANPLSQQDLAEQLLARPNDILLARASIIALDEEHLREVLEKSWTAFGDKLHIKHQPVLAQESNARVVLLAAGRVHRLRPMEVFVLARSSHHGEGISERLASSSLRVRWLGMVVGTAVSRLVDKEGSRMEFGVDEMKSEEARWYQSLVDVQDQPGSVSDLVKLSKAVAQTTVTTHAGTKRSKPAKKLQVASPVKNLQGPKIIEIIDDGDHFARGAEDEDDNLVPHAKPDSDAEDSEEDATLVQRNKPKAPVYVRDLIAGLNDGEDHARHTLALATAPALIRRKADFGSELKDRAEEVASALIGLHDNFDTEDWYGLRQRALTALVVAQPRVVGPWFARLLFVGDYSLSQRAAILTAIGLGCRELAGYGPENNTLIKAQGAPTHTPFPSKRLNARMHEIYADRPTEVDVISRHLEQTMLRPVATKQRARTKILKNDLADVVANSFFFPLAGNWQALSQSELAPRAQTNHPTLVALLAKTLTIVLSAAGQSTATLPQMTSELWALLLSLRARALRQTPLLEATLFGLLTILDVNEPRALARQDGSVLLETREWVALVWEKLEGEGSRGEASGVPISLSRPAEDNGLAGSSDDGARDVERCRYLAAGILVKIKQIADEHQKMLLGGLAAE